MEFRMEFDFCVAFRSFFRFGMGLGGGGRTSSRDA